MTKRKTDKKTGTRRFVLVADDNLRDASYAGMLLQSFGYYSVQVRSGEEALAFFSIAPPSLIITELALPGMSGMDLIERISRDPAAAGVPVIVQTRFASVDDEDRCRRAGCAACLNKPVQPSDLFRAVQQEIEPTPRRNIRVPVFLPATLNSGESGRDFVTMLSDEGLFVKTLEASDAGSERVVTFVLQDRVIRADAVVLYACRLGENPRKEPGMGMKFKNLSAVDRDVIQGFIRDQVSPVIAPPAQALTKEQQ